MTSADLEGFDSARHEALVFIKCQAHPVLGDGNLSPVATVEKSHFHQRIEANSRAEMVSKIDSYLEEVKRCLSEWPRGRLSSSCSAQTATDQS